MPVPKPNGCKFEQNKIRSPELVVSCGQSSEIFGFIGVVFDQVTGFVQALAEVMSMLAV